MYIQRLIYLSFFRDIDIYNLFIIFILHCIHKLIFVLFFFLDINIQKFMF